jgi:magnesium chelatase family protein
MIVSTFGFAGLPGSPSFVRVELRFERGILFRISGFSIQAAKASSARIRSALMSCGHRWPGKAITVNLAPADLSRTSTAFDLPIALAILASRGVIPKSALPYIASAGELGLDGSIRPWQTTIFENTNLSSQLSDSNCIAILISPPLPHPQTAYPQETFSHLSKLIAYFKSPSYSNKTISTHSKSLSLTKRPSTIPSLSHEEITFENIQGEETAKRRAIISAAGSHDLIMLGPPGSGKTVLAKCIHSLLPDLTLSERNECGAIHSAAGHLFNPNSSRPPWQAPHSSTNVNGLIGAWSPLKSRGIIPGSWSLAHNGVLFLDEFAEFARGTLEACRAPLEYHYISLVRAAGTTELPASALLIAALNPCPCGRGLGRPNSCACQEAEVKRYLKKISGPIADRIAIHIELGHEVSDFTPSFSSSTHKTTWDSSRATVARVRKWNIEHLGEDRIKRGPQMTHEASLLFNSCRKNLKLSHRGLNHVRNVALTAALVDDSPEIEVEHIAEAGASRLFDRPTWLR